MLLSCREYVRDPYLIVEFSYESKRKEKKKREICDVWCVVCWRCLFGRWMGGAHTKQYLSKNMTGNLSNPDTKADVCKQWRILSRVLVAMLFRRSTIFYGRRYFLAPFDDSALCCGCGCNAVHLLLWLRLRCCCCYGSVAVAVTVAIAVLLLLQLRLRLR